MTTYASLRKLMEDAATKENLWLTPKGRSIHRRVRGFGGDLLNRSLCGLVSDNWRPLDREAATAHMDAKEGWRAGTPCANCFDVRPVTVTFQYVR
jgi:hypothetical protein